VGCPGLAVVLGGGGRLHGQAVGLQQIDFAFNDQELVSVLLVGAGVGAEQAVAEESGASVRRVALESFLAGGAAADRLDPVVRVRMEKGEPVGAVEKPLAENLLLLLQELTRFPHALQCLLPPLLALGLILRIGLGLLLPCSVVSLALLLLLQAALQG